MFESSHCQRGENKANIKKKIFPIRANEKISSPPNKNIENQARNYNSGRFGDIYDTSYQWKERL